MSIAKDPLTHDLGLVPASDQALTKELAAAADWERFDKASAGWIRCDPPTRNVTMLWKAQAYDHLPSLAGFARQPFFREADGELVCTPGYDPKSQRFAAFDPGEFDLPAPTEEAARAALDDLRKLLSEFRFASEADEATALSAMFTATVRPSLPVAPAFHVRAPTMGSGKSYLCGVIGAFASPGPSLKVSYPGTSEEATKVVQSLLLPGPAVIEFDDMATDWIPHGVINRMLTSTTITDRVLGVSKVATVSTRTLILGSGNNVGPIRDLQRRVATIHLDTRSETPATLTYKGKPAETVRANRGRYVSAVLTIIAAWQRAGRPRAPVNNIASYGDNWADFCRHPLIWLGLPDPANSLLDQVRSEPDSDGLGDLMIEWHSQFGDAPTTLRKALAYACSPLGEAFHDALEDLPIFGREGINRGKLGWYLKKNVNRIVGGLEFRPAVSSERNAWSVHRVDQASPLLPPFAGRSASHVDQGSSKPK